MCLSKYFILNLKVAVFLTAFLYVEASFSQSAETIRSGRPGQTIGPHSVDRGYLQVQTGAVLLKSEPNSSPDLDTQDINTVIRYGFSESLEFSTLMVYQRDQLSGAGDRTGLSRFDLGFRLNFIPEPKGLVPALGFQTRFRLDAVSSEFRSGDITPEMILVTQHVLTEQISWIHNFGLNYGREDREHIYFWASNLSFSLSKKLGAFFEVYGNKANGRSNYFYNGGLYYLLNNDLQLDVLAGSDLNSGVQEQFVSAGVSWRSRVR